jgi:hypothetical protein
VISRCLLSRQSWMNKVTDLLFTYLDAKQHLWNTYFRNNIKSLYQCEPLESFEAIDRHLFYALVCHPLKLKLPENHLFGRDPFPSIQVKGRSISAELPVMIRKPSTDRNSYWQLPRSLSPASMVASFIEFFEWDRYRLLSCSLVRCRIEAVDVDNEWVGREALIDLRNVEFAVHRSSPPRKRGSRAGDRAAAPGSSPLARE